MIEPAVSRITPNIDKNFNSSDIFENPIANIMAKAIVNAMLHIMMFLILHLGINLNSF